MWAIYAESGVREHLVTKTETREEFEPVFKAMLHYSTEGVLWGIVQKATERLLGRCGFYEFGEARTPEALAALVTSEIAKWSVINKPGNQANR